MADKLNVINNLLEKVDTLIIGGGMAYTFLAAKGYGIGTSLLDAEKIDYCKEMMAKAEAKGVNLLLPIDTVVAASFPNPIDGEIEVKTVASDAIPADMMGQTLASRPVCCLLRLPRTPRPWCGTAQWACSRTPLWPRAPSLLLRLWLTPSVPSSLSWAAPRFPTS